ncbi:MAG: PorT family protein [Prevotellaceae bacterium]|jgi:opacity protein-like surface antigen|nr:PorT family protein [Prevotellaceae bacterium]
MKKVLLITLVALLGIATANAQIKVGAKAGVNLSTLSDMDDAKFKLGFHVGGFAEFAISDRIAIQPELLYSTQGTSFSESLTEEGITATADVNFNLSYINLPVLLKVKLAEGLNIEVGPQVGFLLSAKTKTEVNVLGISASKTEDVKSICNSLDVAAAAGLSYTFAEKFVVGARYTLGLTKLNKNGDASVKNGVIQVSFGYKF